MTEHDDNEFDSVRARYRADSKETPRSALDDRILSAARTAATPRARPSRWQARLAVAAVVVLSATLVVNLRPPAPDDAAAPAVATVSKPGTLAAPADSVAEFAPEADSVPDREIVVTGSRVMGDAEPDAVPEPEIVVTGSRLMRDVQADVATRDDERAQTPAELARNEQRQQASKRAAGAAVIAQPAPLAAEEATSDLDDARLEAIVERWRAGNRDAALEQLGELVDEDARYTDELLATRLPAAFYDAWRARP